MPGARFPWDMSRGAGFRALRMEARGSNERYLAPEATTLRTEIFSLDGHLRR